MVFIQWCNDNNGFLTAVLSIIGLMLSIIAIAVSIRTARLPYKKRILLGSSLLLGTSVNSGEQISSSILGIAASATNIGNRTVNLTYLGYAIKRDGRFNLLYPIDRKFESKASLTPSEMFESQFYTDELLIRFSRENRDIKLFVFAKDSEGKEYKRKAGNIGKLLDKLSKS